MSKGLLTVPATKTKSARLSVRRSWNSTHLIPTPGEDEQRPPRYVPWGLRPWLVFTLCFLMVAMGIGIEIGWHFSTVNNGFGVRQDNVFDFIAPSFLISFVPIVLIFPIARLWATADWGIQYVQPYIMLANGNAQAEDSVLLDYMPLNRFQAIFVSARRKHWLVNASINTVFIAALFQPLAGSLFSLDMRSHTEAFRTYSTQIIGLSSNNSLVEAFSASAGFIDAATYNSLPDPSYVYAGWAVPNLKTEGTPAASATYITFNTSAVLSSPNCENPSILNLDTPTGTPLYIINATAADGCSGSVGFTPTVADEQFGVSQVDATSCGLSNQTDTGLLPVIFWFYNVRLGDQGQSTPEAKAVICRPSIALRNVQAKLNMSSMSIDTIVDLGAFSATNNVTSGSLEGKAYNGVIFSNISSAILKARATSIQIGLLGSIYRSASQTTELLDSLFSSEDGFLNLTQQIYTQFLAVAAKSVYLIQIQEEEPITAYATAQVQRLVIDTLAAHFLAMGLLTVGVVGAIIHYLHLPYRRRLHLTAPPGSIATSVALAFHSGFGDRLRPYDDDKSMMRKLSNFRFVTDTRTGAIIAEELNHDEDSMELGPLDQDKDTVALLHDERSEEHYDEH